MGKNIAVIGAGSWGTALAGLLLEKKHNVKLWAHRPKQTNTISIDFPYTCDLKEALESVELVVMVVPSQSTRENIKKIANCINHPVTIVCCSKGLEQHTYLRLSEVIKQELPNAEVAVLSGPSHAEEVAKGIPTAVVAAASNIATAEYVQDIFITPKFRVYTNTDIVGAELGGALKNIIALCAGISDGLGFGYNTKAALMTRGIAEITRFGVKLGSDPKTFAGLAGIGDLIVTCISTHSRNRRAGILIGEGKSVQEATQEVQMVVEGIPTTKAAYELASSFGISIPIITEAYRILYEGKNPRQAVEDLMLRDRKQEI